MSLSSEFIKRPVLTTVCTIVIILIGVICMALLPLDKLPQIAPKRVSVTANYVGADAKTTVDNVTSVLEREINGTADIRWISSNTANTGQSTINVSFPVEVDSNTAQVLVQNRVAQAQSSLPSIVNQSGVTTEQQSPSVTLAYGFYSEKGEDGKYLYDSTFLYNYLDRYMWNELSRIEGVGSLNALGSSTYAMRIWLDPSKLAARGLTATDVVSVIQEQNFDIGTGGIGRLPNPDEQQFEIPLKVQGRFVTEEEAENIVVKVGDNGTLIKIGDIGRAELGVENYNTLVLLDGDNPAVTLIIYQLPGTNALDTANAIKAKMEELRKSFPPGYKDVVVLDNTEFIDAALKDLVVTLLQAIALVVLVIFVFLQDWRTTIIPSVAIPVALIGSMIALKALGFTLNQLTLFACVLATGLVVDDGIVIVESVSNKLAQRMRPLQAAFDSMDELFGAVIATSVVLMAVFIPVSFFPGTTGIVYKQFALTIAAAVLFSTFNALTFSPTMSGILLKAPQKTKGPLGVFFELFNRFFDAFKEGYKKVITFLTKLKTIIMIIFISGLILTGWMYQTIPQGFIPEEDQGYFFVIVSAQPGVSLNYTQDINRKIMTEIIEFEEVDHAMALTGFSFDGINSNQGLFFVKLKNWAEREGAEHSVFGVIRRLNPIFRQKIDNARVFAANAPPVDGLSNFSGLELYIQDRQLSGMDALIDNTQRIMAAANQRPEIAGAFTTFTFNSPILEAKINREKVKAMDVDINVVLANLQTYLGGNYINQFVLDGRLYRVFAQADGDFRSNPDDIGKIYVRSRSGAMVQMSDMLTLEESTYPPIVTNYNVYPAIKVNVSPAQGYSSGQVIQIMEEVANATLQPGFGFEWTNTAAEEKTAGGAAPIVFGLGFVMVFLVLASQYESYIDPTIIMLTVPLSILGALGGIWLRVQFQGTESIWPVLDNNIYVQVGLVMLIGMSSKNAILIVEFANQARTLGMSITNAAIYASTERFRPILMTTISTLFGFLPLLVASGAGSISRWSLGTSVFGGMIISTILSLLFVPNLYIVIKSFEDSVLKGEKKPPKSNHSDKNGGTPTISSPTFSEKS
ncbi:MAG: efflux RND transporter permease subunit [Cyanobacteria bacterium]|nr:efflux RND transporter permease subunit [Cyanobacteria bacterium CG_2015-16_32_12]NCO78464.1 efflux RND transporter permease subunit [Cyanobacteria bacterium CG_2015-22_32_23]NCQ04080.1 efflux RND transporter permease subunit [Cyanobacteria bacterium CG_2015-09_32_10]NCS83537.1 efflux RND transporter permease subunit [Cyanobacteria bacterium CG_2015-02_32_10]